jgi:NADH-quinone oxidoreductase subunit N
MLPIQLKLFLLQSGLGSEFFLLFGVFLIIIFSFFFQQHAYGISIWITIFSLLGGFYFAGFTPQDGEFLGFRFWDSSVYLKRFILLSASVSLFCYLEWKVNRSLKSRTEVFILILLSVIGLNLMLQSSSLVLLLFSAELVSICSFGLSKPVNSSGREVFSVVKYFGVGAFASAIGIFGLSYLVGLEGISQSDFMGEAYLPILKTLATIMFISFLLFKIGSFPFHFWIPDVYESAPTPLVGFVSVAPKVAGVFAILQVTRDTSSHMVFFLIVLVLAGIIIGNFAALRSTTLKNLFAFSSIAQAGILLVPAVFCNYIPNSENQLLLYAISYGVANQAAFCAIQFFENHLQDNLRMEHLSGQFGVHPLASFLFVLVVLSIIGIPPTIGFSAKLLLFSTLLPGLSFGDFQLGFVLFAALVLSTLFSLAYFYQIPFLMIFKDKLTDGLKLRSSLSSLFWLFLAGIFVFLAFFKPQVFFLI